MFECYPSFLGRYKLPIPSLLTIHEGAELVIPETRSDLDYQSIDSGYFDESDDIGKCTDPDDPADPDDSAPIHDAVQNTPSPPPSPPPPYVEYEAQHDTLGMKRDLFWDANCVWPPAVLLSPSCGRVDGDMPPPYFDHGQGADCTSFAHCKRGGMGKRGVYEDAATETCSEALSQISIGLRAHPAQEWAQKWEWYEDKLCPIPYLIRGSGDGGSDDEDDESWHTCDTEWINEVTQGIGGNFVLTIDTIRPRNLAPLEADAGSDVDTEPCSSISSISRSISRSSSRSSSSSIEDAICPPPPPPPSPPPPPPPTPTLLPEAPRFWNPAPAIDFWNERLRALVHALLQADRGIHCHDCHLEVHLGMPRLCFATYDRANLSYVGWRRMMNVIDRFCAAEWGERDDAFAELRALF